MTPPVKTPEPLEDLHLEGIEPLISPRELKAKLPVTEGAARSVRAARQALRDAIHGRDARRLVVIVGPCSIHDPDAALEYAGAAAPARAEALSDELAGGDAHLLREAAHHRRLEGADQRPAPRRLAATSGAGLALARAPAARAERARGRLRERDPRSRSRRSIVADLLAWAAIGARTTESQTHREMASGLSMPVGFKNGTDGGLEVAQNAMIAAGHPHSFLGIDAGRALGGGDRPGATPTATWSCAAAAGAPNYARRGRRARRRVWSRRRESRAGVMVDCSHDNSGKDPRAPGRGLPRGAGPARPRAVRGALLGLMIESYLAAGPAGPGARASRSRTASRSPTPASAGTRPRRCSERSPRRCERRRLSARGAPAPPLRNRQLRRPNRRRVPSTRFGAGPM